MIPNTFAKFFVNVGPIVIFYLYMNKHVQMYEFIYSFIFNENDFVRVNIEELTLWEPHEIQWLAFWMILVNGLLNMFAAIFIDLELKPKVSTFLKSVYFRCHHKTVCTSVV